MENASACTLSKPPLTLVACLALLLTPTRVHASDPPTSCSQCTAPHTQINRRQTPGLHSVNTVQFKEGLAVLFLSFRQG